MESDPQVTVLFTERPDTVNAYVYGPFTPKSLDAERISRHYPHVTGPLEHRGLECVEDWGLSDYIVNVLLPDGSHLTISPPQETGDADNAIPGFPNSWLVTRDHPDVTGMFEMIYDSEPGGPHEHHRGSVPAMLATVYARLEQLGVPGREQLLAAQVRAEDLLREAGFVGRNTDRDIRFQLPPEKTGLTDRVNAVTRAVKSLRAEGFGYACPADLFVPVVQAAPAEASAWTREAAARTTSPTAPGPGSRAQVEPHSGPVLAAHDHLNQRR